MPVRTALAPVGEKIVKLWKWHTMVFRCPCCGKHADYAAQIIEGPQRGTPWDPTYHCEQCKKTVRARDKWLFGGVFGPLMALVGTFALQALPPGWHMAPAAAFAFAAVCCAIIGYPLSRTLSRHLVYWEPVNPATLRQARVRPLREEDK